MSDFEKGYWYGFFMQTAFDSIVIAVKALAVFALIYFML